MQTLNLGTTYNKFFSKKTAISLIESGNLPEENKKREVNLVLSSGLAYNLSDQQYNVLLKSNPEEDNIFKLASTVVQETFGSILGSFPVEMQYQMVVAKYLEMTGGVVCDSKKDIKSNLEGVIPDPLGR